MTINCPFTWFFCWNSNECRMLIFFVLMLFGWLAVLSFLWKASLDLEVIFIWIVWFLNFWFYFSPAVLHFFKLTWCIVAPLLNCDVYLLPIHLMVFWIKRWVLFVSLQSKHFFCLRFESVENLFSCNFVPSSLWFCTWSEFKMSDHWTCIHFFRLESTILFSRDVP